MIARFINRHFIELVAIAAILFGIALCSLGGCSSGLRDDESKRPPPAPVEVMDDVQASANRHPLEGWSR